MWRKIKESNPSHLSKNKLASDDWRKTGWLCVQMDCISSQAREWHQWLSLCGHVEDTRLTGGLLGPASFPSMFVGPKRLECCVNISHVRLYFVKAQVQTKTVEVCTPPLLAFSTFEVELTNILLVSSSLEI